jgi:hypothetical protein
MAAPQGPSCEIRCVIEHHYPEGPKGGSHPVEVRFFGTLDWPTDGVPASAVISRHEAEAFTAQQDPQRVLNALRSLQPPQSQRMP